MYVWRVWLWKTHCICMAAFTAIHAIHAISEKKCYTCTKVNLLQTHGMYGRYDAYRLTPCHMSVFLNEGFQGLLVARIVLTRTNLGQLVFLLSCKSFYWYTYKKDSHLKFYLLVATRAWRSTSLPCSQLNSKRLWGLLECKILPIVEKTCTVIAAKCVWCVSKDE